MSSIGGLRAFVCLILSIIGEVEGAVTSPPLNSVAEVNGEAIFNCSAGTTGPTFWGLSRDGRSSGAITIVTSDCVVSAGFQNHYIAEKSGGPTTCNLIVFNITMEQAGVYHCVETGTRYALLTVLDASPNITYNNTPDVLEAEDVVITCTLNYSGSVLPASTLRPHFYWTDNNGRNVSSFSDSAAVNNHVISQLTVPAGRQDIMPYTCQVYLELVPTALPGYATNTPSVTSSARSPTITVLYGIGPVDVSHSYVPEVEVFLTCNTTGNPSPSYYWTGGSYAIINNTTIQIYTPGYYECNATNEIRGQTHSNSNGTNVTKECEPYPYALIAVTPFLIENLIVLFIFVVCINCNKSFGFAITKRFKWLKKLQKCSMEEAVEILLCICFVIGSLAFGLIVIPIIITIAFCSTGKGQDVSDQEMTKRDDQTARDHDETGHANHTTHDDGKKGSNSKWKIVLMWCLVPVALVPIAFIVVYSLGTCKEMRYVFA